MTTMLDAYATVTSTDVIRYLYQLAESLKGKTVVHVNSTRIGGDAGGIRLQVINCHAGFLVNTPEGEVSHIRYLFNQAQKMQEMADKSKKFVRENFLLTRQLREHLALMVSLQHGALDRIELS